MRSKILLGIGIAFLLVVTVGCSKDSKLVCTQKTSGVDIVFNIGFKGNTIEDMDFSYDMDLSNYSDLQISAIEKQDFCSSVKSTMSQYKDAFTDCKQSVDGSDGIGVGHLGTQESWIMNPDMSSVNNASEKIKDILHEK